jgi:hypothetical protein
VSRRRRYDHLGSFSKKLIVGYFHVSSEVRPSTRDRPLGLRQTSRLCSVFEITLLPPETRSRLAPPQLLCAYSPGLPCSCLYFLHHCDDRHAPSCPALSWLNRSLANFLPRVASNHDPPHLCLLSS